MTFLSLAPSTLSRSVRQAKFLSRPILFESGWNWNLKFWFLRQYDQKAIFHTKWTKNTDDLKTYLVWFSSIVWRGQFTLTFFAQKIQNIYVISQVFSSRSFTWAPLYLRAVLYCFRLCLRGFNSFLFYNKMRAFGWQNTDRIKSAVVKQTFYFFQNILLAIIFYHCQRDIKKHILNLVLE